MYYLFIHQSIYRAGKELGLSRCIAYLSRCIAYLYHLYHRHHHYHFSVQMLIQKKELKYIKILVANEIIIKIYRNLL